jgi:hypothetical protein
MERQIKVGMLASYDYEYLKNSLPPVYERADKIVLAVDKDGKTWAGNTLHIPDTFWQWISDFDTQHKIEIYRDSFYVEGLTTMQCDTRERAMLAKFMGDGGWHVQLDADEYIVDFEHFVNFLHYLDKKKRRINTVVMEWLVLFKRTSEGYLFVSGNGGRIHLATTTPQYSLIRTVAHPKAILYPRRVIHDSWARTEQDLWTKLNNWGHNKDFNVEGYFHYWKAIDEKNYMFVRNFFPQPANPENWGKLDYVEAENIPHLLNQLKTDKNKALLNAQITHRIVRILKMCVPPIFEKLKKKFSQFKSQYKAI